MEGSFGVMDVSVATRSLVGSTIEQLKRKLVQLEDPSSAAAPLYYPASHYDAGCGVHRDRNGGSRIRFATCSPPLAGAADPLQFDPADAMARRAAPLPAPVDVRRAVPQPVPDQQQQPSTPPPSSSPVRLMKEEGGDRSPPAPSANRSPRLGKAAHGGHVYAPPMNAEDEGVDTHHPISRTAAAATSDRQGTTATQSRSLSDLERQQLVDQIMREQRFVVAPSHGIERSIHEDPGPSKALPVTTSQAISNPLTSPIVRENGGPPTVNQDAQSLCILPAQHTGSSVGPYCGSDMRQKAPQPREHVPQPHPAVAAVVSVPTSGHLVSHRAGTGTVAGSLTTKELIGILQRPCVADDRTLQSLLDAAGSAYGYLATAAKHEGPSPVLSEYPNLLPALPGISPNSAAYVMSDIAQLSTDENRRSYKQRTAIVRRVGRPSAAVPSSLAVRKILRSGSAPPPRFARDLAEFPNTTTI